jgi:hypothetical protein
MITAEQISSPTLQSYLHKFNECGGVIDFKVMLISGAESSVDAHAMAANTTMQLIIRDNDEYFEKLARANKTDRSAYYHISSRALSAEEAMPVTAEQFFGPYLDFAGQRPAVLGMKGSVSRNVRYFSKYFYYNDEEDESNVVHIEDKNGSGFLRKGYTDAFLEPPHSFGKQGMTNLAKGEFFLEFSSFLFDNFNEIIVYSWPIDCSNYFDAGKEWWGSFFWTVYNPMKNWYVGIVASSTD